MGDFSSYFSSGSLIVINIWLLCVYWVLHFIYSQLFHSHDQACYPHNSLAGNLTGHSLFAQAHLTHSTTYYALCKPFSSLVFCITTTSSSVQTARFFPCRSLLSPEGSTSSVVLRSKFPDWCAISVTLSQAIQLGAWCDRLLPNHPIEGTAPLLEII